MSGSGAENTKREERKEAGCISRIDSALDGALVAALAAALAATLAAGREILEVYGKADFGTVEKEDRSPLTEADRRAHDVIISRLESETPYPVLSEEGADIPFERRAEWDLFWLVDPLDGTREFLKRNGEFTVNIALVDGRGGTPVAGIVYVPVADLLYLGIDGGYFSNGGGRDDSGRSQHDGSVQEDAGRHTKAAWRVDLASRRGATTLEKIRELGRVLPVAGRDRSFTVVVSRSHNSPETEEYIAALEKERGSGRAERVTTGSSIKLCMVAEGSADVYPRFGPTMEWDTAAADAVCRAAGCAVVRADRQGRDEQEREPLSYNKRDLHNPWFVVLRPQ